MKVNTCKFDRMLSHWFPTRRTGRLASERGVGGAGLNWMKMWSSLGHQEVCSCATIFFKVDEPNSIICHDYILTLELHVVWWVSKNGYQEDICYKDIGLWSQIMITIIDLIINVFVFIFVFCFFLGGARMTV